MSKARHLISDAHPQVLCALRTGEVSIHRASGWLRTPNQQLTRLQLHRDRRGISKTIDILLKANGRSEADNELALDHILSAIMAMTPDQRERIIIAEVKTPQMVVLFSTTLLQTLTRQGELRI